MQYISTGIKKLLKTKVTPTVIIISTFIFLGWGEVGHHIINYNTILSALPEMEFFDTWADSLAAHASDADYRKSWDPDEAPRHYIDIDIYPEFIENGRITQDFDSLVAIHGYNFVIDHGILPWAILNTADSLETAFENNDMHQAMLFAADLGHYMADAHQPLHITKNYDGQYTNQHGVHSRYETHMINSFQNQIVYDGDSLQYIDNLPDYVFNMIYDNYIYVDSVLYADSCAEAYAGNTQDTAYYNKFWELAKNFTIGLFKKASYRITCVIYTEWINAGGTVTSSHEKRNISLSDYRLFQNYPNPFNPTTIISWQSPVSGKQTLKVYDILGKVVVTLVNEIKPAGKYEVEFNASNLPSGIYFYRLTARNFIQTKKMILIK
jgi:Secretion system C-terminal sorting domain